MRRKKSKKFFNTIMSLLLISFFTVQMIPVNAEDLTGSAAAGDTIGDSSTAGNGLNSGSAADGTAAKNAADGSAACYHVYFASPWEGTDEHPLKALVNYGKDGAEDYAFADLTPVKDADGNTLVYQWNSETKTGATAVKTDATAISSDVVGQAKAADGTGSSESKGSAAIVKDGSAENASASTNTVKTYYLYSAEIEKKDGISGLYFQQKNSKDDTDASVKEQREDNLEETVADTSVESSGNAQDAAVVSADGSAQNAGAGVTENAGGTAQDTAVASEGNTGAASQDTAGSDGAASQDTNSENAGGTETKVTHEDQAISTWTEAKDYAGHVWVSGTSKDAAVLKAEAAAGTADANAISWVSYQDETTENNSNNSSAQDASNGSTDSSSDSTDSKNPSENGQSTDAENGQTDASDAKAETDNESTNASDANENTDSDSTNAKTSKSAKSKLSVKKLAKAANSSTEKDYSKISLKSGTLYFDMSGLDWTSEPELHVNWGTDTVYSSTKAQNGYYFKKDSRSGLYVVTNDAGESVSKWDLRNFKDYHFAEGNTSNVNKTETRTDLDKIKDGSYQVIVALSGGNKNSIKTVALTANQWKAYGGKGLAVVANGSSTNLADLSQVTVEPDKSITLDAKAFGLSDVSEDDLKNDLKNVKWTITDGSDYISIDDAGKSSNNESGESSTKGEGSSTTASKEVTGASVTVSPASGEKTGSGTIQASLTLKDSVGNVTVYKTNVTVVINTAEETGNKTGGNKNTNYFTPDYTLYNTPKTSDNTDSDALWVDSQFFDYYTDSEREYGKGIFNYAVANGNSDPNKESNDTWYPFTWFDKALSSVYNTNTMQAINPLYVGHFQPDINYGQKDPWGNSYREARSSKFAENAWVDKDSSVYKPVGLYKDGDGQYQTADGQRFFANNNSNISNSSTNNGYDGRNYASATRGLVQAELKKNPSTTKSGSALSDYGNVQIAGGPLDKNGKGTKADTLPMFDSKWLTKNGYGRVYGSESNPVKFPFKKDSSGYWEFDSSETSLHMANDGNEYYLEGKSGTKAAWSQNTNSSGTQKGDKVSNQYGFFPLNSDLNNTEPSAAKNNYGFGTKLSFRFTLNSYGTMDGSKSPIVYEFSGDDDVWVYVDGKLILDLGGDHGRVSGCINFANPSTSSDKSYSYSYTDRDGIVTKASVGAGETLISSVKAGYRGSDATIDSDKGTNVSTSLDSLGFSDKDPNKINLWDGKQHTLTLFYMERGMWESNMKVRFNLPVTRNIQVKKNWENADSDSEKLKNVYAILTRSFDNGKTWKPVVVNNSDTTGSEGTSTGTKDEVQKEAEKYIITLNSDNNWTSNISLDAQTSDGTNYIYKVYELKQKDDGTAAIDDKATGSSDWTVTVQSNDQSKYINFYACPDKNCKIGTNYYRVSGSGEEISTENNVGTLTNTRQEPYNLPSSGGSGSERITILAAIGAAGFWFLYLMMQRKERKEALAGK